MRKLVCLLFFMLVFIFNLVGRLEAAVFNVSNPQEFQNALTAAASNGEDDVIYVSPGTYKITQTLTYEPSKSEGSLTIVAKDLSNPPILDGQQKVRILKMITSPRGYGLDYGRIFTIKGLKFQNGLANLINTDPNSVYRGAIYISSDVGNVTIMNCSFYNNVSYSAGGAIYAESRQGTITFLSNKFSTNTAAKEKGGGVSVYVHSGIVNFLNNLFVNNYAMSSTGTPTPKGGAIHANTVQGRINVINNTLIWNQVKGLGGGLGGGIYIVLGDILSGGSAVANIYNNIIYANANYAELNKGVTIDNLFIFNIGYVNFFNNDIDKNSYSILA